jgi:hypothetical protein
MNELVSAVFGTILGALLATFFSRLEEKKRTRIQNTIDLYRHFQSMEMIDSRINADRILNDLSKEKPKSYGEIYEALEIEKWHHISRILHFFEQAGTLHSLNYLDEKLFKETIGFYFNYYYGKYLKPIQKRSIKIHDDREYIKPLEYLAQYFHLE